MRGVTRALGPRATEWVVCAPHARAVGIERAMFARTDVVRRATEACGERPCACRCELVRAGVRRTRVGVCVWRVGVDLCHVDVCV